MRQSWILVCIPLVLVIGPAIGLGAAAAPAPKLPPGIGSTPIRFYSGNLSVGFFMHYWGTRSGGNYDPITPDQIAQLWRCACSAMTDYLAWCTAEQEPGKWDFSFYVRNANLLHAARLGYVPFCWLHFPPKWYLESDKFVGYQNLATGKTIPQMSLWSPDAPKVFDDFYKQLAKAFGRRINFIRLAMPSEYGEIGYCGGMTKWLCPQPDAEGGYWCGDSYARADFTRKMMTRYGSIDAINKAWEMSFKAESDIAMPDVKGDPRASFKSNAGRTRWLDFVEWYQQSWPEFMTKSVGIVRKYYPTQEIIVSLGYGEELAREGNEVGGNVARMAQLKVSAQTPSGIGDLPSRRVSSACRAYGVPYYTEPPNVLNREQEVKRIWMDASNGAQTWFDYLGNLDGARDIFMEYKRHLTGQPPVCDVALWLPTYHHWLHPNEGYPFSMHDTANHLRDLCDYEVVDDAMIRDGALGSLGIRVLTLIEAECLDGEALKTLEPWFQAGGVLITFEPQPELIRNGNEDLWTAIVASKPNPSELTTSEPAKTGVIAIGNERWSMSKLWAAGRAVGKGRVLAVPGTNMNGPERADIIAHFNHHLADHGPYVNGVLIDGQRDSIACTLLADRILMFNGTDQPISKQLQLRAADFGRYVGVPQRLEQTVTIRPHGIAAIPLKLSERLRATIGKTHKASRSTK